MGIDSARVPLASQPRLAVTEGTCRVMRNLSHTRQVTRPPGNDRGARLVRITTSRPETTLKMLPDREARNRVGPGGGA